MEEWEGCFDAETLDSRNVHLGGKGEGGEFEENEWGFYEYYPNAK